jgi:hypothetical protein
MNSFGKSTAYSLLVCLVISGSFCGLAFGGPVGPLVEIDSFAAPGNAVQMEYSPQYELLFLRNTGSAIHVVDPTTKAAIDLHLATEKFTDLDLTPDGRYLYAADYGGTQIGYGNPSRPSYAQRYDLQTHTWESRKAPWVVYHIEAVSESRYLVQEIDQHVDMMLNSWGATSQELARIRADYYGDFEYDHRLGRIYHGSSGSSSSEIHARRLVGDTLLDGGNSGVYGTADGHGGTSVLSTDGLRFYYGRLQVEALDITNNLRVFPETIYAATSQFAFGKNGYYDAHTGALAGNLGFATSVYALSDDGQDVWAFNPATDMLHHFVVPEPTSISLACSALTMLLCVFARGTRRCATREWRERCS